MPKNLLFKYEKYIKREHFLIIKIVLCIIYIHTHIFNRLNSLHIM